MSASKVPEKIIEYSFYAIFFLVPLIWLPVNSELFEFNKMILVYLGTSVVLTAWLFKSVSEKTFTVKRTPLDLPIALFLLANIAATVFSIDRQTSFFGYYSRWNGGLLSTFAYIILYYAFVTFFDKERLFRLLKILLLSSLFVAIYGILQHHITIRGTTISIKGIDEGYWAVDSQVRSFSTLGQANWLAAFILMVTPFAFFFLALAKRLWEKLYYTFLLVALFLAFTFTYSRGGTIGFVVMLTVLFLGVLFIPHDKLFLKGSFKINLAKIAGRFYPPKLTFFLVIITISWFLTISYFSNAFLSRGVNLAEIRSVTSKEISNQTTETQLIDPGTETGKIRLIVWKGALDIFKHYPIFGSGVETFAYSYYKFRPVEHNLTSEWDFLYNKAHNEFLNYLATTGSFGFFTYMLLIITFVFLVLTYLNKKSEEWQKYFAVVGLSSFAGYHAQNIFGFSVVAIALLFYLLPAFFFVATKNIPPTKIAFSFLKSPLSSNLAKAAVLVFAFVLLAFFEATWAADYFYNKGITSTDYLDSYKNIAVAASLRPDEPLYKAQLAIPTIYLALESEGKERNDRIAESFNYLNQATNISPNNINIWRLRLQALYTLSSTLPEYLPQTLDSAKRLATLAPNDAETQYNLATTYVLSSDYKSAQKQLKKVVELKYDYLQAWKMLLQVDGQLKDEKSLASHTKEFKRYFPTESIK